MYTHGMKLFPVAESVELFHCRREGCEKWEGGASLITIVKGVNCFNDVAFEINISLEVNKIILLCSCVCRPQQSFFRVFYDG